MGKIQITEYNLQFNGHHVRKATRIIFPDGQKVDFLEKMPKKQAIEQAKRVVRKIKWE